MTGATPKPKNQGRGLKITGSKSICFNNCDLRPRVKSFQSDITHSQQPVLGPQPQGEVLPVRYYTQPATCVGTSAPGWSPSSQILHTASSLYWDLRPRVKSFQSDITQSQQPVLGPQPQGEVLPVRYYTQPAACIGTSAPGWSPSSQILHTASSLYWDLSPRVKSFQSDITQSQQPVLGPQPPPLISTGP